MTSGRMYCPRLSVFILSSWRWYLKTGHKLASRLTDTEILHGTGDMVELAAKPDVLVNQWSFCVCITFA